MKNKDRQQAGFVRSTRVFNITQAVYVVSGIYKLIPWTNSKTYTPKVSILKGGRNTKSQQINETVATEYVALFSFLLTNQYIIDYGYTGQTKSACLINNLSD